MAEAMTIFTGNVEVTVAVIDIGVAFRYPDLAANTATNDNELLDGLDTNVVSELMHPAPDFAIVSWVAERATSNLFLTAVTEAELCLGLTKGLKRMLETGFADRVLPFDSGAARTYARIAAARRRRSRPIAQADCKIVEIARARGMAVATHNIRNLEDIGIEIFNPRDSE